MTGDASSDAATASAGSRFAATLRGFGPYGLLAMAVIVLAPSPPLKAVFALIWASWSRTPWHEIGYGRPTSWISSVAVGGALGIALKFLMKPS